MAVWHPVQTQAQAQGILVYAMGQHWTDVLTQPGPWGVAPRGYCLGLAAHWIQLSYAGRDFPYDPATQEYNGTAWEATRDQNLAADAAPAPWIDHWARALMPYGMTPSRMLNATYQRPPSGVLLAGMAARAFGCYGVTLSSRKVGHAIALRYGRDGRFHLFDGNFGHFVVRTGFASFLDWYFLHTGYAAQFSQTAVAAIKPGAP